MLSNLYIALKNLNVLRIYAYWTETELLQNQINLQATHIKLIRYTTALHLPLPSGR